MTIDTYVLFVFTYSWEEWELFHFLREANTAKTKQKKW